MGKSGFSATGATVVDPAAMGRARPMLLGLLGLLLSLLRPGAIGGQQASSAGHRLPRSRRRLAAAADLADKADPSRWPRAHPFYKPGYLVDKVWRPAPSSCRQCAAAAFHKNSAGEGLAQGVSGKWGMCGFTDAHGAGSGIAGHWRPNGQGPERSLGTVGAGDRECSQCSAPWHLGAQYYRGCDAHPGVARSGAACAPGSQPTYPS